MDAADADDNGRLELTDAVRILNHLFLGGAAPLAPGPSTCGGAPFSWRAGLLAGGARVRFANFAAGESAALAPRAAEVGSDDPAVSGVGDDSAELSAALLRSAESSGCAVSTGARDSRSRGR